MKTKLTLFGMLLFLLCIGFTASAQLAYTHYAYLTPPSWWNGNCTPRIADVDLDGDLDIMMGYLFLNDGSGNFTSTGIEHGRGRFIDLDGDGDPDWICGSNGTVGSYQNDGNGSFTFWANEPWTAHASYNTNPHADLNGDGFVDFVSNFGGYNNYVFFSDGDGTFTQGPPIPVPGWSGNSGLGDLDGDGDFDFVASSQSNSRLTVWENLGGGTFSSSYDYIYYSSQLYNVKIGDINGDGNGDIVVHNNSTGARIFEGDGAFGFTVSYLEYPVQYYDGLAGLIDLDFDGDLDYCGGHSARMNGGTGLLPWQNPPYQGWVSVSGHKGPSAYGDLDGDGDIDAVTSYWEYVNGTQTFRGHISMASGVQPPVPAETLNVDGPGTYAPNTPGQHIDCGDIPVFSSNEWSVECWIKPNQYHYSSGYWYCFIGKDFFNNSEGFRMFIAGGNVHFWKSTTGANWAISPITYDVWTHIAGTYKDGVWTLYVNGTYADSFTAPHISTANSFIIGNATHNNGTMVPVTGTYSGEIDEVRVWSHALCEAEILAQMNCELTGGESGLRAYYQFNEGIAGGDNTSITSLPDQTGNGNDGSINNFTLTGEVSNFIAPGAIVQGTACGSYVCNQPPVAVCQDITVNADDNCEATIQAGDVDGGSTDLDGDPLTLALDNYGPFTIGTHIVTLYVSDGTDIDSCFAIVTVQDVTAPTIVCAPDQTESTNLASCDAFVTVIPPSVSDNCDAGSSGGNSPVTNGLMYYYNFDGNADDIWGTNHGTVDGASLADDQCLNTVSAYEFSGDGEHINLGDQGSTYSYPTGSFTLSAWIKPESFSTAFNTILDINWSWSNYGPAWTSGIYLALNDGKPWLVFLDNDHGPDPAENVVLGPSVLNANQWYHIAGVRNASTGELSLYLDGALIVTDIVSTDPVDYNSGPSYDDDKVNIGMFTFGPGSGHEFDGLIDEVGIFNTALSASEIVQLAASPCSGGSLTLTNDYTGTDDASAVYPLGTTTVNWTATDAAGNSATCVQDIIVVDDVLPAAVCNDITVQLDENGVASITAPMIDGGSTDNCGIASIAIDQSTFDCSDLNNTSISGSDYALDFDDVNDQIVLGNQPQYDFTVNDAFTIEAWINPSNTAGGWHSFLAKDHWNADHGFVFFVAGGQVYFARAGWGFGWTNVNISHPISANTWTHIAGTYDQGTWKMFINGTEVGSFNSPGYTNSSTPFVIANRNHNNGSTAPVGYNNYPGLIDEVRIWNIARTDSEIAAAMNTTLAGTETGLVGYYPFEVGPGSATVSDLAMANTASLLNMDPATDWVSGNTSISGGSAGTLVTLSVTDNSGNVSTCAANVTVEDVTPPIAVANDITINLVDRNTYNLTQTDIDAIAAGSSDNCSFTYAITDGTTAYDCNDVGHSYTVTLTLSDESGNVSSANADVTVADPNSVCNDPPVAVCQDITVYVDENCEVSIAPADVDGGSYDPDGDPLILSLDNSGPFAVGVYTVTLTVGDGEYEDYCDATVTVLDTIAPGMTCISGTQNRLVNNAACTYAEVNGEFTPTNLLDNCSGSLDLTYSLSGATTGTGTSLAGVAFELGTTTITWILSDVSGNTSTCSFDLFVEEDPNLTANAGADATIYIGYPPYNTQLNATGGVSYNWYPTNGLSNPNIANPIAEPGSTTTYTVTVTDAFGCTDTDDVTVEVIDVRCGKKLKKVLVCHIPPGNPNNPQELCLSFNAVAAHLAHGDQLGPCPGGDFVTGIKEEEENPVVIAPNPFSNSTLISLHLHESEKVELVLYNMTGEMVKTIYSGSISIGDHSFRWQGTNDNGQEVQPGMYILRYSSADNTYFYKIIKK